MQRFFVHKPVFAWVIALFIALFGAISLVMLPVEQYPDVAPPALNVQVNYKGADAQTIDRTVTSIIEQEMNGVDNLLYTASTSRANGTAQVTITFKSGTDLDVARTQIQDRLSRVEARLPQEVRQQGLTVSSGGLGGFLMVATLQSADGSVSPLELNNLAANKIRDELRRVEGVADVQLFGAPYAMRIWLDPQKLAGYGLTTAEVLSAVQEQNSQTPGGGIGEQPITRETEFTAKVVTQNRFTTPDQFRDIIVRANPDGSTIRLGAVARVELGQDNYNQRMTLNGEPAAGMGVQLASGANALAAAEGVRAKLKELEPSFPPGVEWSVPFDTTPFITISVDNVVHTLVEAMALVFLVMFLFLQNWRATLIPAIVVPIALAGACLGLYLFGFSINVLSLFGMVVAVGILVDDAIVVVENVERIMQEEGLDPAAATIKAMGQITGAIVGITLVLIAVFVPMAFFPGSTGGIYRQFSVTLAVSIFFSAVLALTLTPALCATLLRREEAHDLDVAPTPRPGVRGWPRRFFNAFNARFHRGTDRYVRGVGGMLRRPARWLAVFAIMCGLTTLLFIRMPGGFLPNEDQGYMFTTYTAPPGATMERTEEAVRQAEAFLRDQPQVRNIVSVVGFSFSGQGQSAALSFVDLHPWEERPGADNSVRALIRKSNAAFADIPGAVINALNPPPIQSLGNASGFSMKIEDRSGGDGAGLEAVRDRIIAEGTETGMFFMLRPEGLPTAPQLFVDVDRVKARALGLSIADINRTLSIAFGSAYANDFVHQGDVLRVYIQAEADQRMRPDDILAMRVRNAQGQMTPFSAFATATWRSGPQQVERYNGYPAVTLSGMAMPGKSSGDALNEMERIAGGVLGEGQAYEWTGTAYEERQASGQIGLLLGLSVVVVFLLLAALYNSWSIPLAVLLVVPFGVLGALVATMMGFMPADIYFNVGLITIIGLAAKNAILIVEFAIEDEKEGQGLVEAIKRAAQQRLRPILMTSLAFILGMIPLVLSTGAGAASRRAVGTGVMGGMIAATLFGVFFTPLFYYAARKWLTRRKAKPVPDAPLNATEAGAPPHA
ncbi:MAG: multidrug efflux RND transporter permease subunit [Brevundimonas sp.]|uniref:multidrug efflux RND transporter permease subunit n=1 Tax=Brevundimonas sp. TaxID=1871086 RepID=UPI00258998CF|nr:multidrug efflux RND transporter permease subunit [Brevundimonas sp.]MCV0413813.1 multidrug efflux RND transporter permease subunit [Brevundimonas sp.]